MRVIVLFFNAKRRYGEFEGDVQFLMVDCLWI